MLEQGNRGLTRIDHDRGGGLSLERKACEMIGILRTVKNKIDTWRLRCQPQAYIISYPKSGRTWLRLLVGKVLCDRFSVDPIHTLNTLRVTTLARVLPTKFTHDGSGMREWSHFGRPAPSKTQYQGKKVVLLVRDPRDVMVSCYFQATKRINVYQGTISDFVREAHFGIERCVTFYSVWGQNRRVPAEFLLVRYEDMHADPQQVLKSVLDFMGVCDVSGQMLDSAVEFGRFDNMKKLEATGHFKRQVLRPGDATDQESFKVRRGKVGGYSDYLNPIDCQYLTHVIADAHCPFLDPYLQHATRAAA